MLLSHSLELMNPICKNIDSNNSKKDLGLYMCGKIIISNIL